MPSEKPISIFVCSRGYHGNRKFQPCQTPGHEGREGTKLCDHRVVRKGKPGTCDRRMCDACATTMGPGKDFCGPYARASKAQGGGDDPDGGESRARKAAAALGAVGRGFIDGGDEIPSLEDYLGETPGDR